MSSKFAQKKTPQLFESHLGLWKLTFYFFSIFKIFSNPDISPCRHRLKGKILTLRLCSHLIYLIIHHFVIILKGPSLLTLYSSVPRFWATGLYNPNSLRFWGFFFSSEANTREFNPLSEAFALSKSNAISKTGEMQSSCFKTKWRKYTEWLHLLTFQ